MHQLVFCRKGREVLRFPLQAEEVRLGRHPDNDISLPDPEVSRFHVVLRQEGAHYRLYNEGRGGTWMQGRVIEQALLHDRDTFEIGSWQILYECAFTGDDRETVVAKPTRRGTVLPAFQDIVAKSQGMQEIFHLIVKVAASPLPVLVTGETGTGKELVARALHRESPRAAGPLVVINCGAIAENLIESELFGHERGAFTGAIVQHRGAFEQAVGGTLFLDEVGELPLALQPKLLRALEGGTFRRVGGGCELSADVRVVAATHRHLPEEIAAGRFRDDLYYRLLGVHIHLPPLRERRDDIPLLVQHFLEGASPVAGDRKVLSAEALQALADCSWPGNVRELRNVLARSLLLCDRQILEASDLSFLPRAPAVEKSLAGAEREAVLSALREAGGNKTEAAVRLGIAKSTLFRKLKEFGLFDRE